MTGRLLLWSATALIAWIAPASALTMLGEFKKWTAYADKEANGRLCVATAEPIKSTYSQPIKGRDSTLFFLSRFPSKDVRTEGSAVFGYPVAPNAQVVVEIDDARTFTMFAEKDAGWLLNERDAALVDAMREGDEMIVRGTSRRGTVTTDVYSLEGVTAAVNAITKACP